MTLLSTVRSLRFLCVLQTVTAQHLKRIRSRSRRTKPTTAVRSSLTPLLSFIVKYRRALAMIHHNANDAPAVATSSRIKAMSVQVKRMLTIRQTVQPVLLRLHVTIKHSAIGVMNLMMAVTTRLHSVTW